MAESKGILIAVVAVVVVAAVAGGAIFIVNGNQGGNSDDPEVPIESVITLDVNGGTVVNDIGKAVATYDSSALVWKKADGKITVDKFAAPVKEGLGFSGYYTSATGGEQIITSSGSLVKKSTDYTNTDGKWTVNQSTTLTLYAQYVEIDFEDALKLASSYNYSGEVFGDYAGTAAGCAEKTASVTADTGFARIPKNQIFWYTGADARSVYDEKISLMSSIGEIMATSPVQLAVDGMDDLVVYRNNVDGVVKFTMIYFACYYDGNVVSAAEVSDGAIDTYSGVMTCDYSWASDSKILEFVKSVVSTLKSDVKLAVGYSPDLASSFVANYGDGKFGSYTLSQSSGAGTATAEGNGNFTWTVTVDPATLYDAAVAKMSAVEGAEKVNLKGYDDITMYVKMSDSDITVYFAAFSEVYFITNVTDDGNSIKGSTAAAERSDAITLINFAIRTIGASVYEDGGGGDTYDVRLGVQAFIDELYVETYGGTWTILDGATEDELMLEYHYKNGSGKDRIIYYRITYEKDIASAYQNLSDLIKSYVGDIAIMGTVTFDLYTEPVDDIQFTAVKYWGSNTSAVRFAMTSGNILIDGSLKPYVDPDVESTTYPFMPFKGNEEIAKPKFQDLLRAFDQIEEYSKKESERFDLTVGTQWFVDNYVDPYGENAQWSVSESSYSTSATLNQDFITYKGKARHAEAKFNVEDDPDAKYAELSSYLASQIGKEAAMGFVYSKLDYKIEGVQYYAIGYTTSTSISMKFVLKVGDVVVDGTAPGETEEGYPYYFYVRAETLAAKQENMTTLVTDIQLAASEKSIVGDSHDVSAMAAWVMENLPPMKTSSDGTHWVLDASDEDSADFTISYHNDSGFLRTNHIHITYENAIDVVYTELASDVEKLDGTTFLKSTTYSLFDEGEADYDYSAVWYNGDSMGGFRFAMRIGNYLIDASCFDNTDGYPYLYVEGTHDERGGNCMNIMNTFYQAYLETQ